MKNQIFNEDCIITLSKIPNKYIDGIITSPPYNMTTERSDAFYDNGYSEIDCLSEEQYLEIRCKEFKEFDRTLNDRGVICYNISYGKNNPILPILLMNKIHNETNLTIADIISWEKNNAMPFQTSPTKLTRIVELIYVIVKKKHLHDFKTNKEVHTISKKTGQKFFKYYTNIIKAKNNDSYKNNPLKASYSQDLCNKLINIYFPDKSLIYDPFIGIGTTALSCINNNCNYMGSEILKKQYDISIERINEKINNTIPNIIF